MIGRPSSLRLYNKRAIVNALLKSAPASRADLAKSVGMSQVTAGKIVDELLADGIVEETDLQPAAGSNRLGRPGRMLQLNTQRAAFLAVQMGPSQTRVASVPMGLFRSDSWATTFATPASAALWNERLLQSMHDLNAAGILAIVISIPGVVDERTGTVLLAPNLHWLDHLNLIESVRKVTGKRVTLLQETRALAYGQLLVEPPAKDLPRDFLLVDFGDGLGAAAVVNGKLFVGPLALNGELGHTPVVGNHRKCGCGAIGCVETLVNRSGLLKSFSAASGKRSPQWNDLAADIAKEGLPLWLRETLDHVATPMAAAANIMGLQRVIITGSLTELPPVVAEHLSSSVINGCLWKRFGTMICHAGERHRLAGLVAAGIDRIALPVESWER